MAATYGASTWKPSQRTNLYCLVNRGTMVWTTCPRSLPDKAAAGSWTRDLPITSTTCQPLHHRVPNNVTMIIMMVTEIELWITLTQLWICRALAASLESLNARALNFVTKSPEQDVPNCSKTSSSLVVRPEMWASSSEKHSQRALYNHRFNHTQSSLPYS